MPLTEKTLIPIGLAVIVIGGGSAWFTSLHAHQLHLTERMDAVERIEEQVSQIKQDIAEIRGILKRQEK